VPALILKQNNNNEGANLLANALEGFSAKKLKEIKENAVETDSDEDMELKKELTKILSEQKKTVSPELTLDKEEQPENQISIEEVLPQIINFGHK